jgi:hypothetical protein
LPAWGASSFSARCAFASAMVSSIGCWPPDYRNANATVKRIPPLAETSIGCMVWKMRK